MWSYGLDLRSIRLTVVKVVVSSEGTCNNCLFVEVFNYTSQQKNFFFKREQEHSFLGNIEVLIPNLTLVFF